MWPIVTTHRTGAPSHVTPPSLAGCVSSVCIRSYSKLFRKDSHIAIVISQTSSKNRGATGPTFSYFSNDLVTFFSVEKNVLVNQLAPLLFAWLLHFEKQCYVPVTVPPPKHAKIKFNCSFGRRLLLIYCYESRIESFVQIVMNSVYIKLQPHAFSGHVHQLFSSLGRSHDIVSLIRLP